MERIKSQFSDSDVAIANEPNVFNRSEAERRYLIIIKKSFFFQFTRSIYSIF